ncbi:hypothetical protein A2W14_05755 [Candidatus Gottesmanbacteria bacterium RBG_16_37_8]|uniref:Sporulation stage II protein D amidase enhancer LytB N-terminal domain-containing protein n=1 Tax=Candidatus Gottesmanbacteria bacterium RBG_16_37_8 TaxID=1798371 RepID=A0A1F5YV43_9BACT|nr:MAG: hypothetical protein A2W14_05755 [Candidatus Gottesmanbacteria bacterium RBG_16_37_8]
MPKLKIVSIFLFLVSCFLFLNARLVMADELEEIEKKLSDLKRALQMSIAATSPLEKNLTTLQKNLSEIQSKITIIEADVVLKEKEVLEGEKLLILAQELLGQKVRQIYISSSQFNSTKVLLLLGKNLNLTLRQFGYQKKAIENDRDTIVKVVLYIKDLENKKKTLESEKVRLASVKKETDNQAQFLQKEITGAKKYQGTLSSQIAQLSARQQQLLVQKLESLHLPTSLGAGPLFCTDDRKLDPGFSPSFAAFTYGIPHRVGMNQYGALGRAKSGQNHKDILNAYYQGISFETRDSNMKIKVQGYGEKNLDEYLLGIYEMPDSWPLEALKAQAVAARSYALAYTNNGQSEICTTQACQVYKGGNKGGNWEKAVNDTKGEIMVYQGEIVKAWYASTFGGFSFTSGDVWGSDRGYTRRMRDTSGDVGSFSDLSEKAYDRESPCFYAAQGFRSEYAKSAWLKSDEVADIVNVLLLAKNDGTTQSHLSQIDKPNPDGVDTWDAGRVKSELKNRGITPYNSISQASVDWDKGGGKVNSISIQGDAGTSSFDGTEFRNFFNLRAPANIQIVGPLYNIERK